MRRSKFYKTNNSFQKAALKSPKSHRWRPVVWVVCLRAAQWYPPMWLRNEGKGEICRREEAGCMGSVRGVKPVQWVETRWRFFCLKSENFWEYFRNYLRFWHGSCLKYIPKKGCMRKRKKFIVFSLLVASNTPKEKNDNKKRGSITFGSRLG